MGSDEEVLFPSGGRGRRTSPATGAGSAHWATPTLGGWSRRRRRTPGSESGRRSTPTHPEEVVRGGRQEEEAGRDDDGGEGPGVPHGAHPAGVLGPLLRLRHQRPRLDDKLKQLLDRIIESRISVLPGGRSSGVWTGGARTIIRMSLRPPMPKDPLLAITCRAGNKKHHGLTSTIC